MDHAEFTRCWTRAQPAVGSLCWAMVRDPHLVDDLIQDVAVAALEASSAYDAERPFLPWVLVIARNRAVDALRRRGRHPFIACDDHSIELLADAAVQEGASLPHRERALRQCLDQLNHNERDLLDQRYRRGTALEQLAHTGRVSASAVKSRLLRLRKRLRACIERRLADGGTS